MKILLYGGTFDPPHDGHINLLEGAIRQLKPDRVIVMPAGTPPHKRASATPASLRLAMCRCFEQAGRQVQLSDWEISRRKKSYTIDTVQMLHHRFPDAQLYLCIGSDMLESFETWKDWQKIAQSCILAAHCRDAAEQKQFEKAAVGLTQKGVKLILLKADVVLQASSSLRLQLEQGADPQTILPCEAAKIVQQYGLYQNGGIYMNEQQAEQLARENLSPRRLQHTLNVRDMAVALAEKYGADVHKAAVAALLHDIAKELPKEEMLQIFCDNAIMAENAPNRPFPVWHGICGAILANSRWGVTDEEILSAIRCHTTGRPKMTKLDKIIFLADMTSAERNYPEVEELRCLEQQDLDKAMLAAMEMTIDWLKESGKPMDSLSVSTLEYLRKQDHEGDSAV